MEVAHLCVCTFLLQTVLHDALAVGGLAACGAAPATGALFGSYGTNCVGTFEKDGSQDCSALATAPTCARSILAVQDNVEAVKLAAAATDPGTAGAPWSAVLPACTNGPYALLSLEAGLPECGCQYGFESQSCVVAFRAWLNMSSPRLDGQRRHRISMLLRAR